MALRNKKFFYKIYDSDGTTLITTWKVDVASVPSWRAIINGSPGEIKIKLARKITNFGEGGDVAFNNKVKLYIKDYEDPTGKLVFSGFMSSYIISLDGKQEYVEVTCLSDGSTLPEIILRAGTSNTSNTTITYAAQDPGTMFADIITKYNAQGGAVTAGDIDTTGTTVTYSFQAKSTFDALEKCRTLSPANWYWRVNADGTVDFKAQSGDTDPDHTLLIGKHINKISAQKRMEAVKNAVYVAGGDTGGSIYLYKRYSSAASQALYGLREYFLSDSSVVDAATAEALATNYLDQYDVFEVRTTITVMDSNGQDQTKGYDIESFKVGQTILIQNAAEYGFTLWDSAVWDTDSWDYNAEYSLATPMQIQSIQYDYDSATLELSTRIPQISKNLVDIARNQQEVINSTLPVAPS